MSQKAQDVTDAELAILQALWDAGQATVRELVEKLYVHWTASSNATVQKLLERLEAKSCVDRDRTVWPYQFRATIERDDLIVHQLQTTADKLCEGEFQPLLTSLVKARGLTAQERRSLRSLLDELDGKKGK
jgi:BlaI family transcriptional regulator, penicillinase repressor